MWLNIEKQRNGPLGRVSMDFYRRFAKFVERGERSRTKAALETGK
jgi:replicative DNA helicase